MVFTHPTSQKLLATAPTQNITPPPAYTTDPTLSCTISDFTPDHDDDDEADSLSSIHLSVSAPLAITGDNNLIAIDPAVSASR